MAQIQVNGKFIEAKEGSLLIDVLLANNINIPHFCYHKSLGKDGNCRMCMVEIEGQKRPQIACDTPVSDGQVIKTVGEKIDKVKRAILELELINHPIDCPICDQAGECKLQDYYMDVGLYESRLNTQKQKAKKHVELGSNVILDQERCVLCTRCVRFTKNITKTNELGVFKRADSSVIMTFPNTTLDNPYASNVVDLCPVGALTSKDFRFHKRVWFLKSDAIICDGCAKGCNIFCDHNKEKYGDDEIYRYRPRMNEKINGFFICDFGRLSYKKENENRFFGTLLNGEEAKLENTIQKAKEILEEETKKVFVISPNLSIEEMFCIKTLCEKFNVKIKVSTKDYKDENFGDDFLKENDLALNKKSAEELKLEIDDGYEFIKEFETCIFVGLKNMDFWVQKAKDFKISFNIINSFLAQNINQADFAISMASHTEKEGTFLTCDNFLQKSEGKVVKNNQALNLVQICSKIANLDFKNNDDIWMSGKLDNFSAFKYAIGSKERI